MKMVRQIMQGDLVTVTPRDNVAFAIELIRRFRVLGLPVVETHRLAGTVDATALYGLSPESLVEDVMERQFISISPDASLQEARQLMDKTNLAWLPVLEEDRLAGIVTKVDVLTQLAHPTDPKTDLPTSEVLRERCVDLLKAGKEPVVLFLDIDGFGAFNKRYGHVVGDRVLIAVAQLLTEMTDPEQDFVVRFGGDEFAMVTTRPRPEARQMASLIKERVRTLRVEGLEEPIRLSIGISGGKRTRVRPHIHYEATVDDLINLASRESTQEKLRVTGGFAPEAFVEEEEAERPIPPEPSGEAQAPFQPGHPRRRPKLLRITFSEGEGKIRVQVELQHSQQTYIGLASGSDLGENSLRLVVEATLDAIRKMLPGEWDATAEDVYRSAPDTFRHVVNAVIVLGRARQEKRLLGAAFVKGDPYRAAACATLDALNRTLTGILGERPWESVPPGTQ